MEKRTMGAPLRVAAAILTEGDKILIARRPGNDRLAGCWEFPGGKIETGETPPTCLRREMKEELGIDVAVGDFFGASHCRSGPEEIVLLAYRCTWRGGHLVINVHSACCWVSVPELALFGFAPADVPFVDWLLAGE